jgi:trk system potassium uptake protein TrkA
MPRAKLPAVFVLIVGAGRVGSTVARTALSAGHEVSVLDEDPLSHERLDEGQVVSWEDSGGRFTVGHAIEIEALEQAGIEEADVFIASTDGDNTNLVIAQIAQRKFNVERVIARVMDPARATWYAEQGLHTICPTQAAIAEFKTALEVT